MAQSGKQITLTTIARQFRLALNDPVLLLQVRPRTTTTLADVTAGFRLRVDAAAAHTVLDTPVIAYGGISPTFVSCW